jgi:hypothetical protein
MGLSTVCQLLLGRPLDKSMQVLIRLKAVPAHSSAPLVSQSTPQDTLMRSMEWSGLKVWVAGCDISCMFSSKPSSKADKGDIGLFDCTGKIRREAWRFQQY